MIHKTARIDPTCRIDPRASIGERCVVEGGSNILGDVKLSKTAWVGMNVTIYGPAEVGEGSYIGSNSIIGYPTRNELQKALESADFDWKLTRSTQVRMGRNVSLRSNCILYTDTSVGSDARFGHNVLLRENVSVGDSSLIGTNVIVDGDCSIGRNVSVQTGVYISRYSTIEDHVFLGPNCVLLNDRFLSRKETRLIGPTIKKWASVGGNAAIMAGIVVGEGAAVGAGAVVARDVPPRTVVAGVPAKFLKEIPPDWKVQE